MALLSQQHETPAVRTAQVQQSKSVAPVAHGSQREAIVVHGGARDAYQVALALSEAGLLKALVTDLFWSDQSEWRNALMRFLPRKVLTLLRQRSAAELPAAKVRTSIFAGLAGLMIDRLHFVPFALRRWCTRKADAALGKRGGAMARRAGVGLLSYSYFGFDAFTAYGRGGILFQAHPHPATMRRILRQELRDHPDCAGSLNKEWELSLPEADYQHLVRETAMASLYLVASSFTRDTLVENGAPRDAIRVIPYGVDLLRFRPDIRKSKSRTPKLRLLFVGRINQRKGLKYVLEALRLLPQSSVELMICGRVVDSLQMFRPFASEVEIRASVSAKDLVRAYQAADLFVFPSVGEGFGQVLLESLACGLPILSTTRTAAPDLIVDGQQGFIVEPRRPDLLADRIAWAAAHRAELAAMGTLARERAEFFTWQRFRTATAEAVAGFLEGREPDQEYFVQRGAA